jgi:hypothetical protein
MFGNNFTDNCGIVWLNGITYHNFKAMAEKTAKATILEALKQIGGPQSLILFSDNNGGKTGEVLAEIIEEDLEWGTVCCDGPVAKNRNTHNNIKAFIWAPNSKFFTAWGRR